MTDDQLIVRIKDLAQSYHGEVRSWRHHIHSNPELSYQEKETSAFVKSKLTEIGVSYTENWAEHGIVAEIKGKNPTLKTIFLRADMDALPIQEENNVAYKSQNDGVMHACGHDVHTSSLLGCIKILNEIKDEFEGTIKCIFQPGEEKFPGGASIIIKEGLFNNMAKGTRIMGQHVHPPLEAGKVGFFSGEYMASADEIKVIVTGRGGHAALPNNCIDTILIASNIIVSLQQVVSRRADPKIPTVLSFGKINSTGGATNVIPDEVIIEGTFRTFDEEWRTKAHEIMKNMAENMAEAMGGTCDFQILKGYPVLSNDPLLSARNKESAIKYLGQENVVVLPKRTSAEDFAYYSQLMPANFYRLGTGNKAKEITSPVHTPTFDIDEEALVVGPGLMAWLALSELNL